MSVLRRGEVKAPSPRRYTGEDPKTNPCLRDSIPCLPRNHADARARRVLDASSSARGTRLISTATWNHFPTIMSDTKDPTAPPLRD
jgi:hypothetical protein